MARKPRVDFEGALSHVIVRGNRRAVLFHDAADYTAYLERFRRYQHRDGLTCYAYVLMANHVHLLVERGAVPLARTMQALQFTYTQYYNRRYHKSGHLFQGRYHAILCDRDAYLVELVRYLHLNPARVRQAMDPWRYRWSSHGAYLGHPSPVVVETTGVLEQFHRQVGPARQAYRQFLREGLPQGHQAQYYETVDQRFLGDDRFLATIERRTTAASAVTRKGRPVPFARLLPAVAEVTGVPRGGLVAAGRQRAWGEARALLVYLAREWGKVSVKDLGRQLHRDPSMISRLYGQYLAQRHPAWERRVRRVIV